MAQPAERYLCSATSVVRNDEDGRMAVLLVTGYAQGPFLPNDHRVCSQYDTRTMPYLDRDDYLRQERWDAHKIPHKTPLNPTTIVKVVGSKPWTLATWSFCASQSDRSSHGSGITGHRYKDSVFVTDLKCLASLSMLELDCTLSSLGLRFGPSPTRGHSSR